MNDHGPGFWSPERMMVEVQKAATRGHRLFLQSPLGRLFATTPTGGFLVLHTTGRRSGKPRQTPLSFTRDGDAYVVIASNGGSAGHPDWYLNLQDRPDAEVEAAGKRQRVSATTLTGDERDRLWRQAVRSFAGYVGYQARAEREIPVVRLAPVP